METMKCYIDRYFTVGKDYKVKDLLDYVGISREAYNNIVKGETMPKINVAIKICEFFDDITGEEGTWDVYSFWKWV